MRPHRHVRLRDRVGRLAVACCAAGLTAVLAGASAHTTAVADLADGTSAGGTSADGAPVQDQLAGQLARLDLVPLLGRTTVLVHGADAAAARAAVRAGGLRLVTSWDRIGVAVGYGTSAQIRATGRRPGVTYLEADAPVDYALTRTEPGTPGPAATGQPAYDGRGVSVAVIDTGADPTHPYLRGAVVKNLEIVCDPDGRVRCRPVDPGRRADTDTLSGGGHGTHVSGIVAGRPTRPADGPTLRGAAPGASLVSIATGGDQRVTSTNTALHWVLGYHGAPCGRRSTAAACPPIKVVSNGYRVRSAGFDPRSATVKLQRALAAAGVLTVWPAGDGRDAHTNPPGQDPAGGVVSVASAGASGPSEFSSRGEHGVLATYPDISARGESITSSCRIYLPICATGLQPVDGGNYNTISGTSMAAAKVAGIAARMYQANPSATAAEVEKALIATATRSSDGASYEVDPRGGLTSEDKGHGLVDVLAATEKIAEKTA